MEFTQKFPPTELENLPVWQLISLKALAPDIMKHVVNQLCGVGLVQCRQWLSGRRTLGELPYVVRVGLIVNTPGPRVLQNKLLPHPAYFLYLIVVQSHVLLG